MAFFDLIGPHTGRMPLSASLGPAWDIWLRSGMRQSPAAPAQVRCLLGPTLLAKGVAPGPSDQIIYNHSLYLPLRYLFCELSPCSLSPQHSEPFAPSSPLSNTNRTSPRSAQHHHRLNTRVTSPGQATLLLRLTLYKYWTRLLPTYPP